jgi:hypothetical protein
MKTFDLVLPLAVALMLSHVTVSADHPDRDPYALEPSINAGISARGLFETQAEEDRYLARRRALQLEPCVNGAVSASGLYPSQAAEDAATARFAGH